FQKKFLAGRISATAIQMYGHNCLANIVFVLVKLSTVESKFVRQSTSNLLVLIPDLLTTS
ncbi:hypothetical protein MKW98_025571, partial [Papaver atlanticum]